MGDYLKLYMDDLESAINEYKLMRDNLEQVIRYLKELKEEFEDENSGQTAFKIQEVIDKYIDEVRKCNNLTAELQERLSEYMELVEDRLRPNRCGEVKVDLELVKSLNSDLQAKFSQDAINQQLMFEFERAIESCDVDLRNLQLQYETMANLLSFDELNMINEHIYNINANKQMLEELREYLYHTLNFENELYEINKEVNKLQEFFNDQRAISLTRCTDLMSDIRGFKLETTVEALNIEIKAIIETQAIDDIIDNLNENDKKLILEKIEELKKAGMYDNFIRNVNKQVELMGIDNFLSNPERIKWLANHPEIKVGDFRSNLLPEQLRMLTEEIPYTFFDEKPNGLVLTNYEFYEALVNEKQEKVYNKEVKNMFGQINVYTTPATRFLNQDLKFTQVNKPGTNIPWMINEDGFQAAVIDVNGEIIIMYPGSQELKEDWLDTDIVPNLLHKVPSQYQKASEFAAEVKAVYPDRNIILTGHSLAGGSVEYAGSENDLNSFYIDPAPGVIKRTNSDYSKGVGFVPGGKSDGILNQIKTDKEGYNKTDTDIDILDTLTSNSIRLTIVSKFSQSNDRPATNETAILNDTNEKNDIDDIVNPGIQDHYTGYGGDHLLGTIDESYKYAYVPLP